MEALAVSDRLAILNLLASYAHYHDRGEVEAFVALFTEDAVVSLPGGDATGRDALRTAVAGRIATTQAQGLQRRHLFGNPVVLTQSATVATVGVDVLLTSTDQRTGERELLSIGIYAGELVKQDEHWRVGRWTGRLDRSAR